MLTFKQLNESNFQIISVLCSQVFPDDFRLAAENFKQSISGKHDYKELVYWIGCAKEKPVGFCGFYAFNDYPEDAFLGWFGVLQQERQKGYGKQIYDYAASFARNKGFTHLRLYTSKVHNKSAVKFYTKYGLTQEAYINKADEVSKSDNILVFSDNLCGNSVVPWNNKNLHINN